MQIIQVIGVLFLLILFFYYLGYGVTKILLPTNLLKYEVWLMPWIGILTWICSGVILSMLGFTSKTITVMVCIGAAFLGAYVWKKGNLKLQWNKEYDPYIGLIVLLSIIVSILPIFNSSFGLTTFSIGNHDPWSYASLADYLKNYGLMDKVKSDPLYPITTHLPLLTSRSGTFLLLSISSSLFGLKSYQIFSLLNAVISSLIPPLLYVLWSSRQKTKKIFIIFMLLLTVFNVNLVYILYHGFFGQLLFQGIFLLTLIFFLGLLDSDSKDRKKYIITLGLLVASYFNIYSEGLAFIILPVALFFVYKAFQNPIAAKNLVLPLVLISLIAVIINPISFFYAIKTLMSQATVVAGWNLPHYLLIHEALGFWSIFYVIPQHTVRILFSITVLVIISIGWKNMRDKELFISLLFCFITILSWLAFDRKYSYGYFKAMTFFIPILIWIFVIGLENVINKIKFQSVAYILLISLLGLSIASLATVVIPAFKNVMVVNAEIKQLEQINQNPNITKPIYIKETNYWHQLWGVYFLNNKKLILSSHNVYLGSINPVDMVPNDTLILYRKETDILDPPVKSSLFSGTSFNLAVPLIGAKLNDLWYELETWPNVGSMRWIQQGGGIEIQSSKKQTLVMKFNAISINGSQALNIYNNGLLVKTVTVMDGRLQKFSIPLTISEANNSIIFKVDNEVKPHSTSDPRLLSIAFGNIGFSEYRP